MNPVQKIGTIQKMVKDSRRYCETETYVLEIVNNYQTLPKNDSCDRPKANASLDEEEPEEVSEEDDAEESEEDTDE